MEITIDHAIDVGYSTFAAHLKDDLQMTFADPNFQPLNVLFDEHKTILDGGDEVKGWITLGDTGNFKHVSSGWEEDSDNTVNTDEEWKVNWTNATTNMSYSAIELAMCGDDDLKTYRYIDGKKQNMIREFAEGTRDKLFLSPTSSSDKTSPHGIPSWLPLGTSASTGGWTGYSARYNDGSTPGTAYNRGGIASTSSSNARYATAFASHAGNLGDNLNTLIDQMNIRTMFIPPTVPQSISEKSTQSNRRYFSSLVVISNLNQLLSKSDDKLGNLAKYHGLTEYAGTPICYAKALDTANVSLYGTNPFYAVNMDWLDVRILRDRNFITTKPTPRDSYHNIIKICMDLTYCVVGCRNPQRLGFLITNY